MITHAHGRFVRARLRPILGLLLAGVLLAACGTDAATDDNDPAGADGSGQDETAAAADDDAASGDPILDFYQCLRDNGLDVADPGQGNEAIGLPGLDMDEPTTAATVEQCGDTHLSASDGRVTVGDGQMGDNVAEPDALIAFVDCLRDHGIDMPDPAPDGQLMLPDDLDPTSTDFQNAGQECAQHLDGGGIRIGGGSGEGGGMVGSQP